MTRISKGDLIERTVYEGDEYALDAMPTNLNDAIKWLNDLKAKIPEKYQNEAELSLYLDDTKGYDHKIVSYKVSYYCEPTEEEIKQQEENKRLAKFKHMEYVRETYERLKKELEG